ncbi:hypothetical protein AB0I98_41970 [Streptomyces sp. NPDC050211]
MSGLWAGIAERRPIRPPDSRAGASTGSVSVTPFVDHLLDDVLH